MTSRIVGIGSPLGRIRGDGPFSEGEGESFASRCAGSGVARANILILSRRSVFITKRAFNLTVFAYGHQRRTPWNFGRQYSERPKAVGANGDLLWHHEFHQSDRNYGQGWLPPSLSH